ncbi:MULTISPECIES: hypothetical protein [Bradyrhizobium]|uniref:hypothetical protein n=1 Tax=Bradyrhizobium TaxID=374 RepID=UPI001F0B3B43|nr:MULTISPECIES: hypothetical protein [Bradyrhizobium]MDI2074277.1 hypothetical protein [Bradyrhizobium sp. Mp27]
MVGPVLPFDLFHELFSEFCNMFVTVVAVLCHFSAHDCTEVVVANSNLDAGITFQGCLTGGQAGLAHWKSAHPIYRSDDWHIERCKCVAGLYVAKAKI